MTCWLLLNSSTLWNFCVWCTLDKLRASAGTYSAISCQEAGSELCVRVTSESRLEQHSVRIQKVWISHHGLLWWFVPQSSDHRIVAADWSLTFMSAVSTRNTLFCLRSKRWATAQMLACSARKCLFIFQCVTAGRSWMPQLLVLKLNLFGDLP